MEFKKLSRKDKYQLIIDKLNLNSFDEKYLEDVYRFLRLKDHSNPYVLGHTDYLTSADEDCNVKIHVEYDRGWKEAEKGNSRLFVKKNRIKMTKELSEWLDSFEPNSEYDATFIFTDNFEIKIEVIGGCLILDVMNNSFSFKPDELVKL